VGGREVGWVVVGWGAGQNKKFKRVKQHFSQSNRMDTTVGIWHNAGMSTSELQKP